MTSHTSFDAVLSARYCAWTKDNTIVPSTAIGITIIVFALWNGPQLFTFHWNEESSVPGNVGILCASVVPCRNLAEYLLADQCLRIDNLPTWKWTRKATLMDYWIWGVTMLADCGPHWDVSPTSFLKASWSVILGYGSSRHTSFCPSKRVLIVQNWKGQWKYNYSNVIVFFSISVQVLMQITCILFNQ